MLHFTVKDHQDSQLSGCQTCCCERMALQPGTISKVQVGYAPWAAPIGDLHCTPQLQIEQLDTCLTPTPSNLPPQITSPDGMARFDTGKNVHLDGDLRTKVTDFEGAVLVFKVLPLYAPKHGKLVLDPSGVFDYDPVTNYTGEERFYCSASDGVNSPFIFEVMIAIEIDAGTMVPEPHIMVGPATVDQRYYTVSFPVKVSPAAQLCEIWRLTVLQAARDCECICYTHSSCYDIGIAKC